MKKVIYRGHCAYTSSLVDLKRFDMIPRQLNYTKSQLKIEGAVDRQLLQIIVGPVQEKLASFVPFFCIISNNNEFGRFLK